MPTTRDTDALAGQLDAVEAVLRDPGAATVDVQRAGEFEQLATRLLATSPGQVTRSVLSRVHSPAREKLVSDVQAARLLGAMTAPQPKLPDWRIVQPLPPAVLLRYYHQAEKATGVPWEYLAAVNLVETRMGRLAGTSTAGAQGPMQFMPSTWAVYGDGGDIHDPHDAILGAGRLLAANGFADHPQEALHHYNNSDGYVRAVTLLAGIIREHPRELTAYHAWQIYFLTSRGPVLLPEGYDEPRPVPVGRWLRTHPQGG